MHDGLLLANTLYRMQPTRVSHSKHLPLSPFHPSSRLPHFRVMVNAWPGQSTSEAEDWPSTNPAVSRQGPVAGPYGQRRR